VAIVQKSITDLGVWDKLNECIKWGRLYGGAIAVALIDGQDPKTPLNPDTIGPDQFKGIAVLDRWMLEPTLEDLITEYGPDMGMPKYYRVLPNAPALRGAVIHYSRIILRHVGNELPYQQALTENLWGSSVIERLYDRMIAFDGASTGIGQLVYKAYLRTLKVKDLRSVIAQGGKALEGLMRYADQMRRFQNLEGLSLIDMDDELEMQVHGAMSGMSDALTQLGQQLSGATGIPLVRLFGQSPAGLNSTGESDLRMYYDNINQSQMKLMHRGVKNVYGLTARSKGITLPDDHSIAFRSLWQLSDDEKATVAKTTAEAVGGAVDGGLIGHQTALKELRASSRITGIFTNITQEAIDAADDEVMPPVAEKQAGDGT
jgi:phage-related protein (TIGR01555 family)